MADYQVIMHCEYKTNIIGRILCKFNFSQFILKVIKKCKGDNYDINIYSFREIIEYNEALLYFIEGIINDKIMRQITELKNQFMIEHNKKNKRKLQNYFFSRNECYSMDDYKIQFSLRSLLVRAVPLHQDF